MFGPIETQMELDSISSFRCGLGELEFARSGFPKLATVILRVRLLVSRSPRLSDCGSWLSTYIPRERVPSWEPSPYASILRNSSASFLKTRVDEVLECLVGFSGVDGGFDHVVADLRFERMEGWPNMVDCCSAIKDANRLG